VQLLKEKGAHHSGPTSKAKPSERTVRGWCQDSRLLPLRLGDSPSHHTRLLQTIALPHYTLPYTTPTHPVLSCLPLPPTCPLLLPLLHSCMAP
jgi:hypothetical protein